MLIYLGSKQLYIQTWINSKWMKPMFDANNAQPFPCNRVQNSLMKKVLRNYFGIIQSRKMLTLVFSKRIVRKVIEYVEYVVTLGYIQIRIVIREQNTHVTIESSSSMWHVCDMLSTIRVGSPFHATSDLFYLTKWIPLKPNRVHRRKNSIINLSLLR